MCFCPSPQLSTAHLTPTSYLIVTCHPHLPGRKHSCTWQVGLPWHIKWNRWVNQKEKSTRFTIFEIQMRTWFSFFGMSSTTMTSPQPATLIVTHTQIQLHRKYSGIGTRFRSTGHDDWQLGDMLRMSVKILKWRSTFYDYSIYLLYTYLYCILALGFWFDPVPIWS